MESIQIKCKDGTSVFNRKVPRSMSDFDRLVFASHHGDAKSAKELIKMLEAEIAYIKNWYK